MIFRTIFFLFILVPYIVIALPIQWVIVKLDMKCWQYVPRGFHKLSCILLGLRVRTIGTPSEGRPTLMVSNHIAWTDILAIGSQAPVTFVAKREVGDWPIVKQLAYLQRTIYADRNRRSETGRTAQAMGKHIADGHSVVLFAEGQSDIGTHVLPFRSALVGAAQMAIAGAGAKDVVLQPVTIAYTKLQGLPVSRNERSLLSWAKSNSLGQNLREIFGGSIKDITVAFGAPMPLNSNTDRKVVTKAAEDVVRANLVALNRGGDVRV
jgi:1-acyl-sn-glycerol-3-phosphate acyltransferase